MLCKSSNSCARLRITLYKCLTRLCVTKSQLAGRLRQLHAPLMEVVDVATETDSKPLSLAVHPIAKWSPSSYAWKLVNEIAAEFITHEHAAFNLKGVVPALIQKLGAHHHDRGRHRAMIAAEFSTDGKLVDYKAKMDKSRGMAAMTAQFCATVTMMFNTLAGAFSQLSGMKWVPQQGWAYSGGDWTVAIGGNKGVFIETAKADFNKLFEALVGSR